ncbi:TPA: ferredoxin, partial [Streptococcus pneumoniae]
MKITLIPERCIACGLCQTYSDLFDYHDNGIVR